MGSRLQLHLHLSVQQAQWPSYLLTSQDLDRWPQQRASLCSASRGAYFPRSRPRKCPLALLQWPRHGEEDPTGHCPQCSSAHPHRGSLAFHPREDGSRGKAKLAQRLAGRKTWIHFDDKHCIVKDFKQHGLKAVMVSKKHNILDSAKYVLARHL